ncbi:galactoside 2-alpha-L-fucosyltransferase [Sorghum bicolor]|uniref:Fucosyltransferase n=1 Tax=Sorghum bicolor TaxID=4558 RepID=C5Y014_SORBI|nr:galactoside 2-alpha-L-fucosyltransferase [Sorghum bicolor]EES06663.1 hypothetical protein SORBI_3004G124800 [Sorghum bicolor]|eukprot:XP_002453687.1 galactoside 2-alpha-L-fucosyltransferase [Sorghum bicolor]
MEKQAGSGGGKAAGVAAAKQQRSSAAVFSHAAAAELRLEAITRRWWPLRSRTTMRTVCVVAVAVTAAAIVLTAGGWASSPNEMPTSSFFDGSDPPLNITDEHFLDGLLTADFSYMSCRSRYEFAAYHKKSSHKPSPYLISKLRKQEALQKRCGPGTAAHKKAVRRLDSGEGVVDDDDGCRYLVYISYRGLGNRMLAIASTFLYAVLTERVLLVDGGKDADALFCEPFPGTTWLLPRPGWLSFSPLRRLQGYEGGSKESLGSMLQSGGITVSADGNASWSSAPRPPYLYLHLSGTDEFHDKLFFCGAHQRLLGEVPWLFMWTDNYIVPGLFLTPTFSGELEAMFPEKDAVFYHLGRYLFHPTNRVWHAIKSYYHDNLAGVGQRVGVQIRVFQKKQPPQSVLDQLLSCLRDEKLLPETTDAAGGNGTPSRAVLLTSLSSWYYDRIRDEYGGRVAGGVHQPSHEGRQRWRDAAHDMKALSEMYLLSMCDVLVTSGFSTFGYVAQGLAGLRPWVMPRAPMWAANWMEELDQGDLPCRRAVSVEPCFHAPSAYDCAAAREVDLDKVSPYISHCVDVKYGIKLVNESSGQW